MEAFPSKSFQGLTLKIWERERLLLSPSITTLQLISAEISSFQLVNAFLLPLRKVLLWLKDDGFLLLFLCICVCVFGLLVLVCLLVFFNYFNYFFIIILFYFGTVSSLGRKHLHWNHSRQRSVDQVLVAIKLLCCLCLLHLYGYAGSQQMSCVYWILQLNTWRYCSRGIHGAKHLDGFQEQNIQTLLLQEARCFNLLYLIPVYQLQHTVI